MRLRRFELLRRARRDVDVIVRVLVRHGGDFAQLSHTNAGNWPLPVKRVLSTKTSCGRTNGASPSWLGSVLNWVQVLTFPCVLIRMSMVKRLAGGPSGARP